MPTYQTAKDVAENALSTIGAFPASQSQADEGELKKALTWLEMIINYQSGIRPLAGFWRIVDIPLEAGIGDYPLSDYVDAAGAQSVFSVHLVDSSGNPDILDMLFENEGMREDLTDTGTPQRVVITKDVKPVMKAYPTPVQINQDQGLVFRLRIQTYHDAIDPTGNANVDLMLRPAWYLWITKRLSYEIGCGPVRKLGAGELKTLKDDAKELENALLARDGQYNSAKPPVTQAYGAASITYADKREIALNNYHSGRGYSNRYRRN